MWFFRSPIIVFGDDALSYLEQIKGRRAYIVTDGTIQSLGFGKKVFNHLAVASVQTASFDRVEAVGGVFEDIPHGRITAVFLPVVIEYYAQGGVSRYANVAAMLSLPAIDESQAATKLTQAIRDLMKSIGLPTSLEAAGIPESEFKAQMDVMIERAEVDLGILVSRRVPDDQDLERLLHCGYYGIPVDF
jgi:alcohol dehydrogenase class IV